MAKGTKNKGKKEEYPYKEKGAEVGNQIMEHAIRTIHKLWQNGEPEMMIAQKTGMSSGSIQRSFDKLKSKEKIKFKAPRLNTYFAIAYAYGISFTHVLFSVNPNRYKVLKYFEKFTIEDVERMACMDEKQNDQMIKVVRSLLPELPLKKKTIKKTSN